MTEIRTDKTLLDALRKAAQKRLTAEEINRQRISFILGSLKEDSTITREQIEHVLAKLEGRAA